MRMKVRVIAKGGRKPKAKWTTNVERKLINIWADFLELHKKMITQRKNESISTIRRNAYVAQELNSTEQITDRSPKQE